MALERKDVRFKLDADMHAALDAIADVDGKDLGEFVEEIVVSVVRRRVHDATVLAERLLKAGITGSNG